MKKILNFFPIQQGTILVRDRFSQFWSGTSTEKRWKGYSEQTTRVRYAKM